MNRRIFEFQVVCWIYKLLSLFTFCVLHSMYCSRHLSCFTFDAVGQSGEDFVKVPELIFKNYHLNILSLLMHSCWKHHVNIKRILFTWHRWLWVKYNTGSAIGQYLNLLLGQQLLLVMASIPTSIELNWCKQCTNEQCLFSPCLPETLISYNRWYLCSFLGMS